MVGGQGACCLGMGVGVRGWGGGSECSWQAGATWALCLRRRARQRPRARRLCAVGPPTCAKAVSTVCTTLEEVQVMVGTARCASALVFRLVLMYTT